MIALSDSDWGNTVGIRNTNWLAHLSGSALVAGLALAKIGREDRSTMALAKANLLRYVDMIRPDGSLPETGDYFHYGMEFALLGLHAGSLHFARPILKQYGQIGLARAIDFALAFTDRQGAFWADFGESHRGYHQAARAVGYLFGRWFGSEGGNGWGTAAVRASRWRRCCAIRQLSRDIHRRPSIVLPPRNWWCSIMTIVTWRFAAEAAAATRTTFPIATTIPAR
jgi:hypothetical protein